MSHADATRRLGVRANSDTPEDSERARRFGAQGIGLCRTEHMFLGDRRQLVEDLILADGDDERQAALDALEPLQRRTSSASSRRWTGCRSPCGCSTRRCTSSCPTSPSCRCGSRSPRRGASPTRTRCGCWPAVTRLHEQNPMLGLRGVRLGLVIPGLFAMQVRAIAEAAASARRPAATRGRRS